MRRIVWRVYMASDDLDVEAKAAGVITPPQHAAVYPGRENAT